MPPFPYRPLKTLPPLTDKVSVARLTAATRLGKTLGLLLAVDQLTKYLAARSLPGDENVTLAMGLVEFRLVENNRGFLGVAGWLPENIRLLTLTLGIGVLLFALGCWLVFHRRRIPGYYPPLLLILAGGLSNLIDRLAHSGSVIDFVSVGVGWLRTGIFNIADLYVLTGSFGVGYLLLSGERLRQSTNESAAEDTFR